MARSAGGPRRGLDAVRGAVDWRCSKMQRTPYQSSMEGLTCGRRAGGPGAMSVVGDNVNTGGRQLPLQLAGGPPAHSWFCLEEVCCRGLKADA